MQPMCHIYLSGTYARIQTLLRINMTCGNLCFIADLSPRFSFETARQVQAHHVEFH